MSYRRFARNLAVNAIEDVYEDGMTEEELHAAAEKRIKEEYKSSVLISLLLTFLPDLIRILIEIFRKDRNEHRMDHIPTGEGLEESSSEGSAVANERRRRPNR